jgi:hypothetical protein
VVGGIGLGVCPGVFGDGLTVPVGYFQGVFGATSSIVKSNLFY